MPRLRPFGFADARGGARLGRACFARPIGLFGSRYIASDMTIRRSRPLGVMITGCANASSHRRPNCLTNSAAEIRMRPNPQAAICVDCATYKQTPDPSIPIAGTQAARSRRSRGVLGVLPEGSRRGLLYEISLYGNQLRCRLHFVVNEENVRHLNAVPPALVSLPLDYRRQGLTLRGRNPPYAFGIATRWCQNLRTTAIKGERAVDCANWNL